MNKSGKHYSKFMKTTKVEFLVLQKEENKNNNSDAFEYKGTNSNFSFILDNHIEILDNQFPSQTDIGTKFYQNHILSLF